MSRIPTMGIYAIENVVNGRVYVGSSVNVDQRIATHLKHIRRWRGGDMNRRVMADVRRYGWEAFRGVVLERTEQLHLLQELEEQWIQRLGARSEGGYNIHRATRGRWQYEVPRGAPEDSRPGPEADQPDGER